MSSSDPTPPRRRHLIDPLNPPPPPTARDTERLARVQRWVLSALAVTTLFHLAAGLVVAAYFTDADRTAARIGLPILAGAVGVLAVAIGRAIHLKPILSPWLLVGMLPTVVGLVLVLA